MTLRARSDSGRARQGMAFCESVWFPRLGDGPLLRRRLGLSQGRSATRAGLASSRRRAGRAPGSGGSVAARPAMKILACRRASWSQSAVCGSGWASIAPVRMMSLGVASGRMVRSRRPRARICSRRVLISLWSATILSSLITGPPWSGRTNSSRAAIVCSRNWASAVGAGSSLCAAARACSGRGERSAVSARLRARARRVVAVEGSDPDARLLGDCCHRHFLAVAPDRDRGGGEDAFAVGRGVASQSRRDGLCVSGWLGHPGGDRASSRDTGSRSVRSQIISGRFSPLSHATEERR